MEDEELVERTACERCGDWVPEDTLDHDGLCEECQYLMDQDYQRPF